MKINTRIVSPYTVIEVEGFLNFESANRLADTFEGYFKGNKEAKILFDLKDLHFVGSSGVSSFVKMLASLNHQHNRPIYCGVRKEFLKLFKAFENDVPFHIIDETDASKVIQATPLTL